MSSTLVKITMGLIVAVATGAAALTLAGHDLRFVRWSRPWWALACAAPILVALLRARLWGRPATLRHSRASTLRRLPRTLASRAAGLPDVLMFGAAFVLAAALARPQSLRGEDRLTQEGIDIVVALDLSESMQHRDMGATRLEAAKAVVDAFIEQRSNDRVGVVAFGRQASTVAPLTLDHDVLRSLVARLELGLIPGDATAIGSGIGMALNRLDGSETASRVIVLVTDGASNAGLDTEDVAQEAAKRGVAIYTVLMGRDLDSMDPERLERIASVTGGRAYKARNRRELVRGFHDLLDRLERSELEGERVLPELFQWLLWPALGLLVLSTLLANTWLRRFP